MKERTIKKKDISEVRERELLPAPSRSLFQVLPSAVTHFFVDLPCLSPFPPPPPPPQLRVEIRELKSELTGTRAAMLEKARKRTPSPPSTPKAPFVDIGRFPPPPLCPSSLCPLPPLPSSSPFAHRAPSTRSSTSWSSSRPSSRSGSAKRRRRPLQGGAPRKRPCFPALGVGPSRPPCPPPTSGRAAWRLRSRRRGRPRERKR